MASIRKQGKVWQAVIRRKGIKTISKSFPKKILAQDWVRMTEEQLYRDAYVSTVASQTTLKSVLERYRDEITPRKKSIKSETLRINRLIIYFGDITIQDFTAQRIIDFVDHRLNEVLSDSVRKELNILSVAVDAAIALWGLGLTVNPVHTARNILKVTKTLDQGNKRTRRPTQNELSMLYERLPNKMALMVEYAIETGMRRGEIAKQRAEHRKGNILLIPETKTDKPRTIPLSKRAVEILDSLDNRADGFVWGYAPDVVSSLFYKACNQIGIVDLRFHDLRHEAASRFFEKGLSIAEVALITGQSFAILQRYTHLRAEDIVNKLDGEPKPP